MCEREYACERERERERECERECECECECECERQREHCGTKQQEPKLENTHLFVACWPPAPPLSSGPAGATAWTLRHARDPEKKVVGSERSWR